MRFVLAAAILLSASAPTLAGSIVGLQEMALMQCAGFPVASMQMNGATLYQYSSMSERGSITPLFGALITRRREVGCEAVVTVRDGVVVDVQLKKSGGLISREIACSRLFSDCP